MIEVIGIFVAAGNREHAGAQDILDAMRHEQRIARVGDHRREARGDPNGPLHSGQQHDAAIGSDAPAVECGDDFLAPDGWEIERQQRIFRHGGCSSRGGMDWMVSTPISINAINVLRDTRQRNAPQVSESGSKIGLESNE
jgi:hypothetical protein